jgi:hypothetical protein
MFGTGTLPWRERTAPFTAGELRRVLIFQLLDPGAVKRHMAGASSAVVEVVDAQETSVDSKATKAKS